MHYSVSEDRSDELQILDRNIVINKVKSFVWKNCKDQLKIILTKQNGT